MNLISDIPKFCAYYWIPWLNYVFISIRYRPGSVPVAYIQAQLGYSNKDKEEWNTFIEPFSLSYSDPEKTKVDCKASAASIPLIKWFPLVVFNMTDSLLQLQISSYDSSVCRKCQNQLLYLAFRLFINLGTSSYVHIPENVYLYSTLSYAHEEKNSVSYF